MTSMETKTLEPGFSSPTDNTVIDINNSTNPSSNAQNNRTINGIAMYKIVKHPTIEFVYNFYIF